MSVENLLNLYALADDIDRREGGLAYQRYHEVMMAVAQRFAMPLPRVTAAFVALSPNSDYHGNLRSLVSILTGVRDNKACNQVTVATYKHCMKRAWAYAAGEVQFLDDAKGLKTRAFYCNVLDPDNSLDVTVDGHMVGAWRGDLGMTMKDAKTSGREYRTIEKSVQLIAKCVGSRPHEVQATLWFTRKRLARAKYNPQMSFFQPVDDVWNTAVDVDAIRPF